MTFTHQFEAKHSYSSHTGLSSEYHEAIEAGNYNNFPSTVILPGGAKIDLSDEDWICNAVKYTPSGYFYFDDKEGGFVRIKVETVSKSPDYDKPRGNGEHKERMTIKSHVPLHFRF